MKNVIVLLAALVLSACGGGSGGASGSAAQPNLSQPGFVSPIDGGGSDGSIALTYYKLSKTTAPVNGWTTKTVTSTGYCTTYQSKVFCWDDGIKTLQWTDFNGTHYGPYTYTYFGFDTNGSTWGSCSGGCVTDLFAAPRFISPTLATNMTAVPVNSIFTNGQAINVVCTETSGILSCGDFTIDLNQGSL